MNFNNVFTDSVLSFHQYILPLTIINQATFFHSGPFTEFLIQKKCWTVVFVSLEHPIAATLPHGVCRILRVKAPHSVLCCEKEFGRTV